jgi:hypothetical protein
MVSFQLSPENTELRRSFDFSSEEEEGWVLEMSWRVKVRLMKSLITSVRKIAVEVRYRRLPCTGVTLV